MLVLPTYELSADRTVGLYPPPMGLSSAPLLHLARLRDLRFRVPLGVKGAFQESFADGAASWGSYVCRREGGS